MEHEDRLLIAAVIGRPWLQIDIPWLECQLLIDIIIRRDDLVDLVGWDTANIEHPIILICRT